MEQISNSKCFGGFQKVFKHPSSETKCSMTFSIYIPPQSSPDEKFPVLYWLSGLTCTEQNFITKSGVQRYAAEAKVVIVGPDTSPRGCNIEGEDDSWDFGTGAGFYVDATEDKWKNNYRMYSYITKELPQLITQHFPVDASRQSIFGHSMGGHGALIAFLKNPGQYRSVSAFAPIANASRSKFGIKCFDGYLGRDEAAWRAYDATEVVKNYKGDKVEILIDQGKADDFFQDLMGDRFAEAARGAGLAVQYREHEGYDHGYYFISTFIGEHIQHHMKYLRN
ncbi:S-formylglutathione hydrolase-like [Paramacrobiotus metropolitanus]|uniref:S-formylglutathione hydrolase-like n=1 Tax=Paramacrobiotus metropolitanus TaxID=2943436 RepID=UPI002445663F|nr:S-formylglutathione hydrolase-like [Paramacrobiotus metropolitanus]